MGNYNTSEFKSGLKILIDGDPFVIVENEMVKPGKAMTRRTPPFCSRLAGRRSSPPP